MEKEYLKYENQFKKRLIFKIIAYSIAFLALILAFFVPMFKWSIKGFAVSSKYSSFSLYDELGLVLDIMKDGKSNSDLFIILELAGEKSETSYGGNYMSYYFIIGLICMLVSLIMVVVDLVKSIMALLDIKGYALLEYDKIKQREEEKKSRTRNFNVISMLITTLIMIIMYIVFSRSFKGLITITSHFGMDGLSLVFGGVFVILLAIAVLVFNLLGKKIQDDIKKDIIKTEYEKKNAVAEKATSLSESDNADKE